MATAATEAAVLPGGGMAFSTVAVICGVGIVGNEMAIDPDTADAADATDATDATEDAAGERGGAGDDREDDVIADIICGGGDAVGVGSDMTSSIMVDE